METLIDRRIPTVSGNEDRILVETARGMLHSRTAVFSTKWLDPIHLAWLAKLPVQLDIGEATLFHGVPGNDTTYLLTAVDAIGAHARSRDEIVDLVAGITQRILLCGHDHAPREVTLDSGQVIVNPGSVGCPAYTDDVPENHSVENGSPHARYALLKIHDRGVSVEIGRASCRERV